MELSYALSQTRFYYSKFITRKGTDILSSDF